MGQRPDFTVRAPDPNREGKWMTVGAAWNKQTNGKPAVSVKLNSIPVGFDGTLMLMTPTEGDANSS